MSHQERIRRKNTVLCPNCDGQARLCPICKGAGRVNLIDVDPKLLELLKLINNGTTG